MGGILAVRNERSHTDAMKTHGIAPIDLVVVNLYPFEDTVARGAQWDETIENIDIGGPAMIRSAAKNHAFVAVLTDPSDYTGLIAATRRRRRHDHARPAQGLGSECLCAHREL